MQNLFAQYCDVPLLSQEQTYWCWAAADQMIRRFKGVSGFNQCDDANSVPASFGCGIPGSCCPSNPACNRTCYPHPETYYTVSIRYGYLSWTETKAALKTGACSPFIFAYTFSSGGTHFRVARGYFSSPMAGNYILINDPNPLYGGPTYIFYDDYRTHSNTAWHNIN
jgi:hypothetical protein